LLGAGVLLVLGGAAAGWAMGEGELGAADLALRDVWRMPPLRELQPGRLSRSERLCMFIMQAYLVGAGGLVLMRIVQLCLFGSA
jgi:hypothetical protein